MQSIICLWPSILTGRRHDVVDIVKGVFYWDQDTCLLILALPPTGFEVCASQLTSVWFEKGGEDAVLCD